MDLEETEREIRKILDEIEETKNTIKKLKVERDVVREKLRTY